MPENKLEPINLTPTSYIPAQQLEIKGLDFYSTRIEDEPDYRQARDFINKWDEFTKTPDLKTGDSMAVRALEEMGYKVVSLHDENYRRVIDPEKSQIGQIIENEDIFLSRKIKKITTPSVLEDPISTVKSDQEIIPLDKLEIADTYREEVIVIFKPKPPQIEEAA